MPLMCEIYLKSYRAFVNAGLFLRDSRVIELPLRCWATVVPFFRGCTRV